MPEQETVTFEFIRRVQREEQGESTLSKLPEDFYKKTKQYLDEKKKLKKKGRIDSLEVTNAERIIEDVFNRRENKIIDHAVITARTDIPPENLIEEEEEFFEKVVNALKSRRQNVLYKLFKKKEDFQRVEFLDGVEEFTGIDLKNYGPFNKGDKALIPTENAELLLKAKKVKEV